MAVRTINRPLPDITPGRKFALMDFGITSATNNIAIAIKAPTIMVVIADMGINTAVAIAVAEDTNTIKILHLSAVSEATVPTAIVGQP
jgi:hypothetical protein